MNNNLLKEFLSHMESALDEFRGSRDITEIRDQFLSLYLLQFLSSESAPFPLSNEMSVSSVLAEGAGGLYGRLNNIFMGLEERHAELDGIFVRFDSHLMGIKSQSFSELALYRLLEGLNSFFWNTLPNTFPTFFDELIAYFAENGKGAAPDFHTPMVVANMIAALLEPRPGMSIYDPVCGSGALLAAAASRARANKESQTPCVLAGQDANLNAWRISKQNMLVHRFIGADIKVGNVLEQPENVDANGRLREFDIVVANPPFSLSWKNQAETPDRYKRFIYGMPPSQNADYAFIQHILTSLKDGGLAAVIVSDGVLFRGSAEQRIREAIVRDHNVDAVISLPPNLFYGTPIPTNILILRKGKAEENILFIDGRQKLQVKDKRHKVIDSQAVSEIVDTFINTKIVEGLSRAVSLSEVAKNDFNLTISRYISPVSKSPSESSGQLIQKQVELEVSLASLQVEMKKLLGSTRDNV